MAELPKGSHHQRPRKLLSPRIFELFKMGAYLNCLFQSHPIFLMGGPQKLYDLLGILFTLADGYIYTDILCSIFRSGTK